jgi:hypothetical protein
MDLKGEGVNSLILSFVITCPRHSLWHFLATKLKIKELTPMSDYGFSDRMMPGNADYSEAGSNFILYQT